jgi:predicted Rossmann fold flavoprotein
MQSDYDAIIVGGGAAGLMCAIEAGNRGKHVLVLEHADEVGKKILISGGGRCNFTNLLAVPEMYLSDNPRFAISALSRYTSADFTSLVERHGIAYHEKKLGQLFCDDSAKQIVAMLCREYDEANVEIATSCSVTNVQCEGARFSVTTTLGPLSCDSLVVATGGLSIPKMGATGFAYDLAKRFGIAVTATRPGLVPFTFRPPTLDIFNSLSGVSVDTSVTCGGVSWRENVLFTHRGLSGPAILQTSSFWRDGNDIEIDLLPDVEDALVLLRERRARRLEIELAAFVGEFIPKRLAIAICGPDAASKLSSLSNKRLEQLAESLKHWVLTPDDTEGYRTAEVTVGGIDTAALSSQTMEARGVPGLYFIGEAVDVTGPLGGYNFQWAWASGYCAGQVV